MPERDVAAEFEWYADWAADISPLYERLARGVAGDPDLLDIAAAAPEGQPAPQLLLAAVQNLLLDGADHPLAEHYPTCTDDPVSPGEVDPFPRFRSFCLDRETAIRDTVASRRVQTNEVGRSAVLFPAFARVARRSTDSLALVEVGASAGLNLCWDRYRYEYGDDGVHGDPDSSVVVESAVRGERGPPFPDTVPGVVHRVGVDLNPLDAADDDDARWLRSLVIPDQRARRERLAAAIDLVARDPPDLVAGDALDVLPAVLDEVPDEGALCVFSTLTLYQLGEDAIVELRDLLTERSRERTVHWLSDDLSADRDVPTYRHATLSGGDMEATQIAAYESYGEWVRWLAEDD